jgi:hypothetical protein
MPASTPIKALLSEKERAAARTIGGRGGREGRKEG